MTSLEIPAFVIGVTGLIAVSDKCLSICRIIGSAKNYGKEVVELLDEVKIEHYRFWLFIRYLRPLLEKKVQSYASRVGGPLTYNLSLSGESNSVDPIVSVLSRIEMLLREIQEILEKNKVLEVVGKTPKPAQAPTQITHAKAGSGTVEEVSEIGIAHEVRLQTLRIEERVKKSTSFRHRLSFVTTTWHDSDKKNWLKLNGKLSKWIDRLYGFLPTGVRDALAHQALLGNVLDDIGPDVEALEAVADASGSHHGFLKQASRLKMTNFKLHSQPVASYEKGMKDLEKFFSDIKVDQEQEDLRLVTGKYGHDTSFSRITLEYLSIRWQDDDERKVSESRIKQVAFLCQVETNPPTLRTLNCIGYVFDISREAFAFVWQYPKGADSKKAPVSLNSLLKLDDQERAHRNQVRPSLSQKIKLAQHLASALLTFHGVDWLHKNFNSHSVYIFFREPKAQAGHLELMYDEPFIGGFDVARPDDPGQVSLAWGDSNQRLYDAPKVRLAEKTLEQSQRLASEVQSSVKYSITTQTKDDATPQDAEQAPATQDANRPPRFKRSFDVYSLGMLLFEIGTWDSIDRYSIDRENRPLAPFDFTNRIRRYCRLRLPSFMGNRYMDVTLKCLDGDYSQDQGNVDGFYLSVVQELAMCHCQD